MELRNLITFVTVVETGNMTQAAMRCNITQGAASQQIKAFEKELNAKLFDRRGKELVLTESGKIFLRHARVIIKELKDSQEELDSMKGKLHGELRIGVGSFIEPYIRKSALRFMERHPGVFLNVQFGHADVLNRMLKSDQLDMAFTMNLSYHDEGIVSEPCISFRLSAIMSKDHHLAQKDKVSFEDLKKCRVIMPDVGERVFQTFQRFTKHDISKLNVAASVSAADAALKACVGTNFVTFLPSEYADSNADVVAKPIEMLENELISNAHYMRIKPLKESAKVFMKFIEELRNNNE